MTDDQALGPVPGWSVGKNSSFVLPLPSGTAQHSFLCLYSLPLDTGKRVYCSQGLTLPCFSPPPRPAIEGGISEVEIISQHVDEETKSIAPGQLVNLAYRDLPLAALDLSTGGSQLLSNLDEEYQREG